MRAGSPFYPLRHRGYAAYWAGSFISNIGTWMESVALTYFVAETTRRGVWSGVVAAAGFLPIGLLSSFGGVVADRFSRRPVVIAATTVQLVVAGVLTVLARGGNLAPGVIAALSFVTGCAGALSWPSYTSAMRDLVPPEELTAAVGLGSASWNLGRVLGPAAAGLVITLGGVAWALAVNTISFLAVLLALAMVRLPSAPRLGENTGVMKSMLNAVTIVRGHPELRLSFSALLVNTMFGSAFIALIPAMAKLVFRGTSRTQSALVTAQGLGAVAGALLLGLLTSRYGHRASLFGAMCAVAAATILYGLAPSTPFAVVALVGLGGSYLMVLSGCSAIGQRFAPIDFRGRVIGLNTTVLGLVYPVASVVVGAVSDRVGLRQATVASGVAYLMVLAAIVLKGRVTRPLLRSGP